MMKRILPFFIVLVTLMSCSISEDELISGDPQLEPSNQPALDYTFKGVWTVDDIKGIETYARTLIDFKGSNYVACATFPFAAIMEQLLPDVKVAKISDSAPSSSTPTPEEELWIQTLMDHGSDRCLEANLAVPYRCIGLSEQSIYLEMMPNVTYGTLYLPFIVTKDDGKLMAVVLTVAPTQSTALLDKAGASFSSRLTVTQIETIVDGQSETRTLNPTMQLNFTSIERVK